LLIHRTLDAADQGGVDLLQALDVVYFMDRHAGVISRRRRSFRRRCRAKSVECMD
jgi:hypothetical protein